MLKLWMITGVVTVTTGCGAMAPVQAQTVMQQCGQQYQAAKSGGTLNGVTWNQYRTECAARLKATPASDASAPAAPPPAAQNPLQPTTAAAAPPPATSAPALPSAKNAKPVSAGRTAMLTREKQCGAEWRAQKVSLVAQTPGLTWPKYWSQCNTRLKAAGQ